MNRTSVFKRTNDNWCPSYIIKDSFNQWSAVEVSFIHLMDGLFRVCAWGADDIGMERDYESENEACVVFLQVIGEDYVDVDLLIEKYGFKGA